jgi:membrane-bound lytic murein transglycosylase D
MGTRRAAAVAAFLGAIACHGLSAQAAESSANQRTVPPEDPAGHTDSRLPAPQGWLPPLQGHEGPEVYTMEFRDGPAVAEYVASLRAGNLGWLRAAMDRATLYRSYVFGLLDRYGLPYELSFLPVIESEYRPWAVSRSGASGIWQFMSNSIAGFGMRIDDMVDERRDFWKATDAALRKLSENYRHFGDWLLALAAYNCGRGCMDRIIASSGITDFWRLRDGGHLPPETARFVPKFLGIARVGGYPGRYGLPITWETAARWDRLPIERSVNIELLAAVTGAPLALLERGNAELHYPVTPDGATGYQLKVPSEHRQHIEAALADPALTLMRFHVHTIRTGDTLYGLGQRFQVSVDLIERHNVGIDASRLRIGAKVFIPLMGEPEPEWLLPSDEPATVPVLAAKHVVENGDTLWSLSRRYGLTVEDLARGNALPVDSVLRPGAVLGVPVLPDAGSDNE